MTTVGYGDIFPTTPLGKVALEIWIWNISEQTAEKKLKWHLPLDPACGKHVRYLWCAGHVSPHTNHRRQLWTVPQEFGESVVSHLISMFWRQAKKNKLLKRRATLKVAKAEEERVRRSPQIATQPWTFEHLKDKFIWIKLKAGDRWFTSASLTKSSQGPVSSGQPAHCKVLNLFAKVILAQNWS